MYRLEALQLDQSTNLTSLTKTALLQSLIETIHYHFSPVHGTDNNNIIIQHCSIFDNQTRFIFRFPFLKFSDQLLCFSCTTFQLHSIWRHTYLLKLIMVAYNVISKKTILVYCWLKTDQQWPMIFFPILRIRKFLVNIVRSFN